MTFTRFARRGFTLIEIMMAVTIFSFAIIPLSMFARSGSRNVEGTRDIAGAVMLAQKTLEQVRSYPYELLMKPKPGAPPLPAGVTTADDDVNGAPTFTMGRITYTRSVEIRELSAGSGFEGRVVRLKVSWSPRPKDKPLEYETWTVLAQTR